MNRPATREEAIAALDLRMMPTLPNAKIGFTRAFAIHYSAPGTIADAESLHRSKLFALGWTVAKEPPLSGEQTDSFHVTPFEKGEFRATLLASKLRDMDGWVNVQVENLGNIDARTVPQPSDANPNFSYWGNASYRTDMKPVELVAFYRKELTTRPAGTSTAWPAPSSMRRKTAISSVSPRTASRSFIKGAKSAPTVVCIVSLRDRPAETPLDKIPKAATFAEGKKIIDLNRFVRLGTSEGHGSSADLVYVEPDKADQVCGDESESFYRENLKLAGWTEDDASTDLDDEARLVFAKEGYLLSCNIRKQDDKSVVRLENMGNVRAADIPRLPDASERTREPANDILYETQTPLDKATEFYRQAVREARLERDRVEGRTGQQPAPGLRKNAIEMKVDLGVERVRVRSRLFGEIVPRAASEELTLRMVDLRKLPRFKDAAAAKRVDSAHLEYVAPGTTMEVRNYHRQQFQYSGWRALPQRWTDPEERFEKDGFVADLRVEPVKDDDKSVAVTLRSRGDVDLRFLPIVDPASVDPKSVQEEVRKAGPASAEDLTTQLQQFGWTKRNRTRVADGPLGFQQNAFEITILIQDLQPAPARVDCRTFLTDQPEPKAK